MVLKPSSIRLSARALAKSCTMRIPKGSSIDQRDGPNVGAPLFHPEIEWCPSPARRGPARKCEECRRVGQTRSSGTRRKSPNVLLDDADFEVAVKRGVLHVYQNSGQSCKRPTRMLVPRQTRRGRSDRAAGHRRDGRRDPTSTATNVARWCRSAVRSRRAYIEKESRRARSSWPAARDACRLSKGYYVKPRCFQCAQRHDDRARGNFRTGALHPPYETEEQRSRLPMIRRTGCRYVWSKDAKRAGAWAHAFARAGCAERRFGDMQTPFAASRCQEWTGVRRIRLRTFSR